MTVAPDFFRCFTYTLIHLLLFFLGPIWIVRLVTTELNDVPLVPLLGFTIATLVVMVPAGAAYMTVVFRFTITDRKLVWEMFNGAMYRELAIKDIRTVRFLLFVYHVSSGIRFQGISLPALFLLTQDDQRELSTHLRKVLPDGHPLSRLAR